MSTTGTINWRPVGHAEWESEDWHWTIVSRPVNYPDNGGPRTYSVRDMTTREWLAEDFPTFEEAAAECERRWKNELREAGVE